MLPPFIPGAENFSPDAAAIAREEREQLLAAEESLEQSESEWSARQQVFRRLCAHFFSAGPPPEEVLQRVFAAAADRRPDLLHGLPANEQRLAVEESPRGRRWRLKAIYDGRGADWREAYRTATKTLSTGFLAARRPEVCRVTLNEALSVGGCEPYEATETLSRTLERIFRAGSAPRVVAQQTFALVGWLFRDLQWSMSLDALGKLFDEQRASQSWRSKKYVETLLRRTGCAGIKAPWQKPESACRGYAKAALGNKNRKRKRRAGRSRRLRILPLSSLSPLIATTNQETENAVYSVPTTEPRTSRGSAPEMAAA